MKRSLLVVAIIVALVALTAAQGYAKKTGVATPAVTQATPECGFMQLEFDIPTKGGETIAAIAAVKYCRDAGVKGNFSEEAAREIVSLVVLMATQDAAADLTADEILSGGFWHKAMEYMDIYGREEPFKIEEIEAFFQKAGQ